MLDFEKSSGYDLAKIFDKSMGFFWTASFQQIYRELHKLEKEELVRSEAIAQMGKPDKNIYEMTATGGASTASLYVGTDKRNDVKRSTVDQIVCGETYNKKRFAS